MSLDYNCYIKGSRWSKSLNGKVTGGLLLLFSPHNVQQVVMSISVSGLKIFILFSVRRYMYEWEVAWPRLWHAKTFNETFVCGTITFGTTTLATVFRKGKRCQIIGFSTFECSWQIDNRIAISGIYSTVLHPSLIGNRCSTGFEEVSFQVMMRLWKGVRSSDDYDCLLHLPRYTCWARNCH